MTYHRIAWHPEVTPYNTAICDDCGALIPVGDQERHDEREAKINALLGAATSNDVPPEAAALVNDLAPQIEQNRAEPERMNPRPTRARAKKEEADVPGNGA